MYLCNTSFLCLAYSSMGGQIIDDTKTSTGESVTKPVITRDRTTDQIPLVKDKYMAYQYRVSKL